MKSVRLLATPHQPAYAVKQVIVNCAVEQMTQALSSFDMECIAIAPSPHLRPPLNAHADLLVHPLGRQGFLCTHLQPSFPKNWPVMMTAGRVGEPYPLDCLLNGVVLPPFYIGNEKVLDDNLQKWIQQQGYFPISIKQGYAKCNICIVDHRSIITSDKGIFDALASYPIDVLLISPGSILLKNYQYGFIGGASGLIAPDKLAFCGQVEQHPDGKAICAFTAKRGVECISLWKGPLLDLGSIIPATELV